MAHHSIFVLFSSRIAPSKTLSCDPVRSRAISRRWRRASSSATRLRHWRPSKLPTKSKPLCTVARYKNICSATLFDEPLKSAQPVPSNGDRTWSQKDSTRGRADLGVHLAPAPTLTTSLAARPPQPARPPAKGASGSRSGVPPCHAPPLALALTLAPPPPQPPPPHSCQMLKNPTSSSPNWAQGGAKCVSVPQLVVEINPAPQPPPSPLQVSPPLPTPTTRIVCTPRNMSAGLKTCAPPPPLRCIRIARGVSSSSEQACAFHTLIASCCDHELPFPRICISSG